MIARFVLGVLASLASTLGGSVGPGGSVALGGSVAPGGSPAGAVAPTGPGTGATVTGPAVTSGPRVPPGVQTGPARLQLLGQSTDVEAGQSWQVHLAVRAPAPSSERLRLEVYDRLTTRTGFDQTLHGRALGSSIWRSPASSLTTLSPDSGGGVTITVPLDTDLPGVAGRGQSGIYPVQVQLLDGDYDQVDSLTTYLVFVAGTPAQTGFPKLNVSLTLPIHAAPVLPPTAPPAPGATATSIARSNGQLAPATVAAFDSEVAALERHPTVPLSLQVTPQTADMLEYAAGRSGGAGSAGAGSAGAASGSGGSGGGANPGGPSEAAAAAVILRDLAGLVAGGDELLPGTYVDTSLGAMAAAKLSSEVTEQLSAGATSLDSDLHHVPETSTWVVNGPLDQAAAQLLEAHGATRVIVPAADLQALPQSGLEFTVAVPAELSAGATRLSVDAADPELAQHFARSGDQILAANQLLAELEMIQLETPSRVRGVAIVPPAGWHASAAFLDTLLAGLSSNPLLQPVTADQLFADVPVGTSSRSKVVRVLAAKQTPAPVSGARTIERARTVVAGYSAVLPRATATASELDRRILVAESSDLSAGQRARVLASVLAAGLPLERGISLPQGTSITLTARKGNLPLTILNHAGQAVRVELHLSSDKLSFERFSPAGGSCTRISESAESCQLTLSSTVTTIKVPVEARTSGVFSLNIAVLSPDGSLLFASNRDTVRSTAVSGVGVILIVLAALGLGFWWLRNIRHGRRARQLIAVGELPEEGEAAEERGEGRSEGSGGTAETASPPELDDLDRLAEFFASPPPVYPRRSPTGPSGAVSGSPPGLSRPGAPPVSPSGGGNGRRG